MKDLTITSLIGRINHHIRMEGKNSCRFSVRNGRGLFFIEADGPELVALCRALSKGDIVYVLARPRSNYYRTCSRHHVHFEAITILPVEESEAFEKLLETVTQAALKEGF